MSGHNVFYPMGFDDNGLPTERLVEKRAGRALRRQVGRAGVHRSSAWRSARRLSANTARSGSVSASRLTGATPTAPSTTLARRTSQRSFLDLYRKGLAYRQEAPAIWCPECQTRHRPGRAERPGARDDLLHARLHAGGRRDAAHRHDAPGVVARVRRRLRPSRRCALFGADRPERSRRRSWRAGADAGG